MLNSRFRMVSEQSGCAHISSVVLTEEEALESLRAEMLLHTLAGWEVAVVFADAVTEMVVHCRDVRGVERTLSVLASDPMGDIIV